MKDQAGPATQRIGRWLLLMALSAGCWGCGATVWWGNRTATLHLGMSKQQVQQMLGPPQDIMTQELNGMMVDTWKYVDRTVTFQNGVLRSWGTLQASPTANHSP